MVLHVSVAEAVMIFLVPVPDAHIIFSTVFQQQQICTKSCRFDVRISNISQKDVLSLLIFFTYFTFHIESGTKSISGTEMHSGSGSAKAKS
jgi:hypothetical protein